MTANTNRPSGPVDGLARIKVALKAFDVLLDTLFEACLVVRDPEITIAVADMKHLVQWQSERIEHLVSGYILPPPEDD